MLRKGHGSVLNRAAVCLLATAAVGLHLGCGLETFPGLLPPQVWNEVGDLGFQSPADLTNPGHLPYFKGYEVYYKLYDSSDDAGAASGLSTELALTSAGYRRLTREGENPASGPDRPLIPVEPAQRETEQKVYFTFTNPGEEPTATLLWDASNPVRLRRGVGYPSDEANYTEYQLFSEFDSTDLVLPGTDLTAVVLSQIQAGFPVYLSLYALSFGLDGTGTFLSEATYLFYVAVQLETSP